MARATKEQSDRTAERVLEVAGDYFTRCGYGGVGLEEIAAASGVTRGAVYHHYANKKGLFVAVAASTQHRVALAVAEAADRESDPWDSFVAGCRAFLVAILADDARQILLLDAPSTLGWNAWRRHDAEASGGHLVEALEDLAAQHLIDVTSIRALAALLSGALNEAALWVAHSPDRSSALNDAWTQFEHLILGLRE